MLKKITPGPLFYFFTGIICSFFIVLLFAMHLWLKSPYECKVYVSGFWTIETQLAYYKLAPQEQALLFEYILATYITNPSEYSPVLVQEALAHQRKLHLQLGIP